MIKLEKNKKGKGCFHLGWEQSLVRKNVMSVLRDNHELDFVINFFFFNFVPGKYYKGMLLMSLMVVFACVGCHALV